MKNFSKLMIFAAAAALVAGCGLLKTKDVDQASVDAVHKVAVVAYSADLPASAKIGINLSGGGLEGKAGGSMMAQSSHETDEILASLQKSLGANMSWQITNVEAMTANDGYKTAYDKTMKGWQNKMPPNQGTNRFEVKNVMDFDSARILDVAGRDKLINDLGVDAIVAARVSTVLKTGVAVMGIGARHPQTSVTIFVYKKGDAKPIWFQTFTGKESEQSVGSTGFTDEGATAKLALESATDAFAQIRTR
jgi:hypothetical protein